MTSTDTNRADSNGSNIVPANIDTVEITRDNALDMLSLLHEQERTVLADLRGSSDPAERARICQRGALIQQRRATAWALRPGRARLKAEPVAQCRTEARMYSAAAEMELLRARAADQGRALPDPLRLLVDAHDETATRALITLYAAAAEPMMVADPEMQHAEHATLAVDAVILAWHEGTLYVLLVERKYAPYKGLLALPGGLVEDEEDDRDAAQREPIEETGVAAGEMHEVGTYRKPGRDPRGRVVSFAWGTVLSRLVPPVAGDDARHAQWMPVQTALAYASLLAFDHEQILRDGLAAVPGLRGLDVQDGGIQR